MPWDYGSATVKRYTVNNRKRLKVLEELQRPFTFYVESPDTEVNMAVKWPSAIIIDSVSGVLAGSSTPSVTCRLWTDSNRDETDTAVTDSTAVTSTTTGDTFGLSETEITAGDYVILTVSAVSGTVARLEVTIAYHVDV